MLYITAVQMFYYKLRELLELLQIKYVKNIIKGYYKLLRYYNLRRTMTKMSFKIVIVIKE